MVPTPAFSTLPARVYLRSKRTYASKNIDLRTPTISYHVYRTLIYCYKMSANVVLHAAPTWHPKDVDLGFVGNARATRMAIPCGKPWRRQHARSTW